MQVQGFCGDVRPALLRRPPGLKDRLLRLVIGDRIFDLPAGRERWRDGGRACTGVQGANAEAVGRGR